MASPSHTGSMHSRIESPDVLGLIQPKFRATMCNCGFFIVFIGLLFNIISSFTENHVWYQLVQSTFEKTAFKRIIESNDDVMMYFTSFPPPGFGPGR